MSCIQLTLGEIPAEEDLAEFLEFWHGKGLHLYSCPSFDDRVLDTMGKVNPPLYHQTNDIGVIRSNILLQPPPL
jgi:hypothetical protein